MVFGEVTSTTLEAMDLSSPSSSNFVRGLSIEDENILKAKIAEMEKNAELEEKRQQLVTAKRVTYLPFLFYSG